MRARLAGVAGDVREAALAQRLAVWGWRCWVCGRPYEALDHVKPLSVGGAHLPCNIRPICTTCNNVKHNKWPLTAVMAAVKTTTAKERVTGLRERLQAV